MTNMTSMDFVAFISIDWCQHQPRLSLTFRGSAASHSSSNINNAVAQPTFNVGPYAFRSNP